MKVLICGKGGSGKSTLSALISVALKNLGYRVLLVDADESNLGLHRLMGVSSPISLMDHLGGKKAFKSKLSPSFPKGPEDAIFSKRMSSGELSEACLAQADGIRLLVVGKIHAFGEGCACAMGLLSKTVLSKLDVADDEIVVVDTEAGVEHFGRKVDAECDMVLGVIDPTYESFMLAKKMQEMAEKAETEIFFVLNKVSEKVEAAMQQHINAEKVIARIPHDDTIFMDSLEGKELTTTLSEVDPICRVIREFRKSHMTRQDG